MFFDLAQKFRISFEILLCPYRAFNLRILGELFQTRLYTLCFSLPLAVIKDRVADLVEVSRTIDYRDVAVLP